MFWSASYSTCVVYSYFEKGCRKKKNIKMYATRPKGGLGIHWNLHIGQEEIYKFVFLHVENLFFLSGAYIFSFTFTVACL